MIVFVVGTTAELIKIAPVFRRCVERGAPPLLWFTGQHVDGVEPLLARLGLPAPHRWLARGARGRDLQRPAQVPRWVADLVRTFVRGRSAMRRELRQGGRPPVVVIHGDTFTTVVGAVLGRALGASVAHVEAGLRSGSLLSPFPEEINRRLAGRLVDLHFPPTPREVGNLRKARGAVVLTHANTVLDSLRMLDAEQGGDGAGRSEGPGYTLATLHRFELLQDRVALEAVLRVLQRSSQDRPVRLYAGAPERERFARYGLDGMFDERFRLEPKLAYLDFLPVLAGADVVVTDSGGLQEECAYLGVPCVVHRARTERHQGVGENVVVTELDLARVVEVLEQPGRWRRAPGHGADRPSDVIVQELASRGHL